jgi:parvulin-like peptidyl-prolyl isomerase
LPRALEDATARQVADAFGGDFAAALSDAPVGAWHGPLASSFGLHLVRVDARVPARAPALDEVREQVVRELEAERRREIQESFERALRERYEIVLPEALAVSAAPVARE